MFSHFTITFSSFVKICIGYLTHWTHLVIISCIFLIIRVGISHTCRRLDIQHIGNLVPAEFVLVQRSPIIIYLQIRFKTFLLKSTLLSARVQLCTQWANSHEMVHSLRGTHPASCSQGLRSTRAPEGLWLGPSEKLQTCRKSQAITNSKLLFPTN